MKAYIPATKLLTKKQMDDLNAFIAEWSQLAMRQYMMLTAVVLNESHGFGSSRLTEMFDCMSELVQVHAPDDEEFWTHVEQRCRQLKLHNYFYL